MGIWLVAAVILQLACAICAAKLGRPTIWLQIILLVPVLGSMAYCGSEAMRALAIGGPRRPASHRRTGDGAKVALGGLGFQAVRAQTIACRRALAEECMRRGRHADARLLFESCLKGRDAQDPELIERLQRATDLMDAELPPTGTAD